MQKALAAVPGVRKASVELEKKTANVTFDPDRTTVAKLVAAVERAGFKATPVTPDKAT